MTDAGFTHLHLHSQYSLLDGAIRLSDLVPAVKEKGMSSVAVTDHGNMYGAIDFYKTAKKHGVKPILGCEAYVAGPKGRHDRSERSAEHLVLLAKDNEGYKNLSYLVSMGFMEGYYYHPRVDRELLQKHSKGLYATSACLGGVVARALSRGGEAAAAAAAKELKELFEPGHFFLELQSNGYEDQVKANEAAMNIAELYDIPLVATADAHYLAPKDSAAHEVLMCIKENKSLQEFRQKFKHSDDLYVKSPAEMYEAFAKICPQAVENSARIAADCNVTLDLSNTYLPRYQIPEGHTLDSYLEQVAVEGLKRRIQEARYAIDEAAYKRRLEYELGVITKMGFAGYFLVVWDFIRYAKEHGIPVGPGRGSGAGSLVAFCLRITDLDPIPHDLLFERFLNPERVSMPDFDIDFCQDRRGEVIDYVTHKYGTQNVGQIVTYAQLSAKSVIKDVGRVMELPFQEVNELTKLIPGLVNGKKVTIDQAMELEPKLKQIQDDKPVYKDVIAIARALEGLNRQTGMHAAGIVIGDKPLWDYVPICRGKDGELVTQFAKDEVEQAGLVKFDFLGLKTLTVIANAVKHVRQRTDDGPLGPNAQFDIGALPLDDAKVYQLVATGDTDGVFQLESSGFKELLKRLKPDRFEDIVAAVALYRPGPLDAGMVDDYIARKHGKKQVTYPHPVCKEILEPTYGVIVYQEQVMRIAVALSGFTMGEADTLRKAMGKKKADVMAELRAKFVDGAVDKSGMPRAAADELFTQIEKFAGYAFNKCLVGGTTVIDATTGERTTIGDLYARPRAFTVHALGGDWKLRPRRVTDVVANGKKPVFELRTAQGKTITATGNHPFRTLDGWTLLQDLSVGDRIAAPRALRIDSDVVWESVVAIEPRGIQETFDLTVEDDHNFVADDLIVHNSHSAAYAVVTYQTAYLKAYYPVEFTAALLSTEMGVQDNVVKYISSAKQHGIKVLPPDVNASERDFTVVRDGKSAKILFGLGAVKGIGDSAIDEIREARQKGGAFESLFEFCERASTRKINRKVLEALVKSGCFDVFDRPREQLLAALDRALEAGQAAQKDRESGQTSLFGLLAPATNGRSAGGVSETYPDVPEWSEKQKLAMEKEALGFFVSGHPLDRYAEDLPRLCSVGAGNIASLAGNREARFSEVAVGGIVTALRERPLKSGNGRMAFVTLEDLTGSCEVLVFSKVFNDYEALLKSDEPILVRGAVMIEGGDEEEEGAGQVKLRAASVELLSEARAKRTRRLELAVPVHAVDDDKLARLKELLVQNKGEVPTRLTITQPHVFETVIALPETLKVNPTEELLVRVDKLFGQKVVRLG